MSGKFQNFTSKANSFFAEAGPGLSVTGQQFIAGLGMLGILLSLLFQKNMFFPAANFRVLFFALVSVYRQKL